MNQDKIWDYFQNEDTSNFDAGYSRLKFLASKFNKKDKLNKKAIDNSRNVKYTENAELNKKVKNPKGGRVFEK